MDLNYAQLFRWVIASSKRTKLHSRKLLSKVTICCWLVAFKFQKLDCTGWFSSGEWSKTVVPIAPLSHSLPCLYPFSFERNKKQSKDECVLSLLCFKVHWNTNENIKIKSMKNWVTSTLIYIRLLFFQFS